MTNQIKRGKFSVVPSDKRIQLNMMSKDLSKIDVNSAGMITKKEADKIVKDVNKMLSNAGIEPTAKAINMEAIIGASESAEERPDMSEVYEGLASDALTAMATAAGESTPEERKERRKKLKEWSNKNLGTEFKFD